MGNVISIQALLNIKVDLQYIPAIKVVGYYSNTEKNKYRIALWNCP